MILKIATLVALIISASATALAQPATQSQPSQTEGLRPAATNQDQLRGDIGQPEGIPVTPQLPEGFPLAPDHQKYIEQLLEAWEKSSGQIKRCVVDFQRIEYNPELCNYRDPRTGALAGCTVIQGEIRFQAPDKASYEADKIWDFAAPPEREGGNPQYKQRTDADLSREKWICDGEATYEFDFQNKRLYEQRIPSEYRGEGLVNSPLPFVFGAKKDVLLNRYWIKVITPRDVTDAYWLEIYPKRASDAKEYQKIQLVISQQDFLPSSMHIFSVNYHEANNPVSRFIEFGNRRVNGQLSGVSAFLNMFIRPKAPLGWETIDRTLPTVGSQQTSELPDGPGNLRNR